MTLLRTPADIGTLDFARATKNSARDLKKDWDAYQVTNLEGYEDNGKHIPGAFEKSPNYYDVREGGANATAPIPWNAFPRALDRWHKVLSNPTPAKQSLSEATADTIVEYLFWWEPGDDGTPQITSFPAHLVGLLSQKQQASARRARLGSGSGKELSMCYRQQDEYCEWHAEHDDKGRLVRLSFTAEPPEYWTFLAAKEPDLVFQLYRELVGQQVQRSDIFYPERPVAYGVGKDGVAMWIPFAEKGDYNQYNKWNSTHGAIHLTHPANTLGAEIDLAARSSLAWQSDVDGPSPAYDDDPALTRIACGGYGGINRSSDPSIGEQVGIQVTAGNRVSLTDPIGLYIAQIDLSTLERETQGKRTPVPRADVLSVGRGDADPTHPRMLHLKLEAPVGADWTIGDCFLDNRRIERGGQIARKITMVLYADVKNGGADKTVQACRKILICRHPDSPGFFGTFNLKDVPACASATPQDWSQEIPLEQVNLPAGKPQDSDTEAATPAHIAPVGDKVIAGPAIAKSRAALR